jgi:hypothetical protein
MPFDPKHAGWTEHLKPLEPPPEETDSTRAVSYTALLVLVALVLGFATMAFPYAIALTYQRDRPSHRMTSEQEERYRNSWIEGDTKAKAGFRFAAGALAGASLAGAYLVLNAYRRK